MYANQNNIPETELNLANQDKQELEERVVSSSSRMWIPVNANGAP